jgi:hypothetical protein
VLLCATLTATAGCAASSAREDLGEALRDTQAAVGSAVLAVDLLQQGRTTRAAAEVSAGDMVDQIGLVQQQILDVPAATVELRDLRHRSQLAVTEALVAVQDTEDVLAESGEVAASRDELVQAQRLIATTAAVVGDR